MTIATLERKLRSFEAPIDNQLLRWLYLHLPPQPIRSRKMHRVYTEAVRVLMVQFGGLNSSDRNAVTQFLRTVAPFIEQYEKKEFPIPAAAPEDIFRFLLEQHKLSQYDVAREVGGQPVVSEILRGKRRLTREHIERLSKRFGVTPATFYPGTTSA